MLGELLLLLELLRVEGLTLLEGESGGGGGWTVRLVDGSGLRWELRGHKGVRKMSGRGWKSMEQDRGGV